MFGERMAFQDWIQIAFECIRSLHVTHDADQVVTNVVHSVVAGDTDTRSMRMDSTKLWRDERRKSCLKIQLEKNGNQSLLFSLDLGSSWILWLDYFESMITFLAFADKAAHGHGHTAGWSKIASLQVSWSPSSSSATSPPPHLLSLLACSLVGILSFCFLAFFYSMVSPFFWNNTLLSLLSERIFRGGHVHTYWQFMTSNKG